MSRISDRGARLIADVAGYVAECEEAHRLLDFAERAPHEIEWHPERGQSLRAALRNAMQRERGGE